MWRIQLNTMPAKKPASLIKRHETAEEKSARASRESSVRPEHSLPKSAPTALRNHKLASEAWRRLSRLYGEVEGEIVTRMDADQLVDYCLLAEQVLEIDQLRKSAFDIYKLLEAERVKALDLGDVVLAISLSERVTGAFDGIVKLDARSERKRALLKQYRESLYLTPRARAGAAPEKKEKEEPPDPLEQLLGNVTDFVNGDGK
jgi:phage terminase small subunit